MYNIMYVHKTWWRPRVRDRIELAQSDGEGIGGKNCVYVLFDKERACGWKRERESERERKRERERDRERDRERETERDREREGIR